MQRRVEEPRELIDEACVFPTSFAQRRIWFLAQLAPGNAFYNIHNALPLEFPVDAAVLERTFNEIVRRHESLRTTFEWRDDEPVQVVADELQLKLQTENLSQLSAARQEQESARLAAEQARKPFDLVRGPLLRTTLLKLGPARNVLLLTIHHIVADAWSLSVLYRELAAIYQAFASGRPSPLPELSIQYADFAVWQSDWLRGEVLREQMDYWRRQLDGASVLELATDRPRPAINSLRGASHRFEVRPGLVSRLETLSRREDCTLFMTLLAGFFLLLYRYTGQRDLLVGTPIANRNETELEPLIGFFVNTLVVRIKGAHGGLSFRQLMAMVRETTLEAYGHQDLPFEKLVEEVQPVRDMSRNPIYQVTFQLHNAPDGERAAAGHAGWVPQVHRGTSNFDLAFELWHVGEGLAASLDYSTDLFDPVTMTRFGHHYLKALEGVADDPDRGLATLSILTTDEETTTLRDWNETARRYPLESCIHHLFEQVTDSAPVAAALRFEGRDLSYAEVDSAANRIARGLRRRGVRADRGVGICLHRSPEMIYGILGILKAGGAYVALDPDDPPSRMAGMLTDAGCSILLTEQSLLDSLLALPVERLVLDGENEFAGESEERLPLEYADAGPDSLAYISFTSGSTGRPKGVGVAHQGVVNLCRAAQYVEIGPGDAVLQFAPISFDASTFELWGPLLNGACAVIHPAVRPSLEELGHFIAQERLTVAFLTTGLLHQMIDVELESLMGLRCVLTGGDVLSGQHAREFLSRSGAPTLINCYGPTECTMFVSCWIMNDSSQVDDSVSIGRVIANTRFYLLDRRGNPVPVGVWGELLVGGDGLAKGYVNQPGVTAEGFVPDWLSSLPGARLYRTGDRVRYRSDGRIEFMGRVDRQLKIRGYRIEPAHVEANLRRHPAVREVTVQPGVDAAGSRILCAYIVASDETPPTHRDLRFFLQQELPDFMLPSDFLFLESIPLTSHGKVNVSSLEGAQRDGVDRTLGYVAPETEVEIAMVPIWEEVVGVERIGIHDNFFTDLPGHSLLGTLLIARISRRFQIDLELRKLFEAPDIASLALVVEEVILGEIEDLRDDEIEGVDELQVAVGSES